MSSSLRVNTIVPSTGTNVAIGTANGTVTFTDSVNFVLGTGSSIFSPASNTLTFGTNDAERLRITSAGSVGIGTDTPGTTKLKIETGSGTRAISLNAPTNGTYITFETAGTAYADIGAEKGVVGSGSADTPVINARGSRDISFRTNSAERLRITSAGDLFVAGTGGMNTTQLPNGNTINVNGTSSNDGLSVLRYSTGYGAYGLNIGRSKSDTIGTNAAVTNGNDLGHISFYGADGTDFNMAAQITSQVDGTPSDGTDMPGRLVFKTSSDGSATPTERLRITSDGDVRARRSRSNTAGDVALSIQPSDSTIHYGFRIDSANNNLNIDRVGTGNFITIAAAGHVRVNTGDLRVGDDTDSNAGSQTISVGSVSSGSGGIGIFANPTNGNSFVQFGDGTSSADQYRGYMNYRHADDSLRFGTAGTDRLHINSTGNIGIGTDNPGEPLHVFVGNGGNGEPIALFEHNHGGGGDASIRIEGGASGNPDEVYLELCDKDDSANSYTMGMNDDVTRLRFEYGARGTNNGKVLLSLDQNGAARFNGASGVLRDPTINNTSYVGLSLWPSGTGGASNYSDNHNISFTQEEGNWLDGHSNSTHSSFGMVFNYTSDGTTMLTRGGMHYDHRGAERLKIWSSYGDISFKTDNGLTGNKTWGTCNKEGLRITNSGHVLRPTMAAAAVTLSAGQTTLSTFNTSYQTLALNSEGYDNANNFNTSNYRFTAPETGFYQVGCNVQLENGSRSASGNRWMYLYPIINGANSPSTSTGGNNADFDPADTYYYNWTYTTLLKLSENDYVEWKYRGNLDSVNLRGQRQSVFYFYQVG